MDKIQIELAFNSYLFFAILVLSYTFVHFSYKSTKPELSKSRQLILSSLRSLILSILLFLLADLVLHFFSTEKAKLQVTVLHDQSKSTEKYQNEYDEKIKALNSFLKQNQIKLSYLPFSQNKNSTDILNELNQLESKKRKQVVFLLSDGNQNTNTLAKGPYNFPIFAIPLGKVAPKNHAKIEAIELKSSIKKRSEISQIPIRISSENIVNNEKKKLNLYVNDSLITSKSLSLRNGLELVTIPYQAKESDSLFNVKAQLFSKPFLSEEKKTIKLKNKRKQVAYIYVRPNLNARAINQALLESDDFDLHYIGNQKLSRIYSLKIDLFILSDFADLNNKQQAVIAAEIQKNETAFILVGKLPQKMESLAITQIKKLNTKHEKLRFSQKQSSLLESMLLQKDYKLEAKIPELTINQIEIKSSKKEEIKTIFNDQNGFLYLLGTRFKKRALIINSPDFWFLKSTLASDTKYRFFFKDLVHSLSNLLLQNSSSLIQFKLDSKSLIQGEDIQVQIQMKDQNNNAINFDYLKLSVFSAENELIESIEIPFNKSGSYLSRFKLSEEKSIRLKAESYVSGTVQFRKSKNYTLATRIQENEDQYINFSFFESIGAKQVQSLDSLEAFFQNSEDELIIREDEFQAINMEYFLYFLLVLLILEWILRKQFKLL